jgi:DNA-binding response OmpR family regulator
VASGTIKVIIIEDETALRSSIVSYLNASGMDVRGVGDAASFNLLWNEWPADVVILDIGLPGEDGISISSRLQGENAPGIIILTARSSNKDHMEGLIAGADSYLIKPVDLRILDATICNLARRLDKGSEEQTEKAWVFDLSGWTLTPPNHDPILLTSAEFGLLLALSENPGHAVRRQDIVDRLNQHRGIDCQRNLEVLVTRLRRKIEAESGLGLPIRSVRSIGYVFHSPLERRGDAS